MTFGCSLTRGHALDNPEQECWPAVLANCLGRTLVNTATSGASNKRIWHTVINYNFDPDDIAITLWTYENRMAVIKEDGIDDILPFNTFFKSREMNHYKFTYNEYDSNLMSKLFASHTNLSLNSKNVAHYNLIIHPRNIGIVSLFDNTIDHIPIYFDEIWQRYPLANDNSHPGRLAHKELGEKLFEYLNNQLTHN